MLIQMLMIIMLSLPRSFEIFHCVIHFNILNLGGRFKFFKFAVGSCPVAFHTLIKNCVV